jgi:hypothetical protein
MKNVMKMGAALLALLLSGTAGATCNANVVITKPDNIYVDHGNGTVTDKDTGLMWMQCSQGLSGAGCATGAATAMNWKQALEAVQTANSGAGTFGYTDWRLPNAVELLSLAEQACYSPAINTTLFPATVSDGYWTSSPLASGGDSAWIVNFDGGEETSSYKSSSLYVRLVRGGQ